MIQSNHQITRLPKYPITRLLDRGISTVQDVRVNDEPDVRLGEPDSKQQAGLLIGLQVSMSGLTSLGVLGG
jgi:hypothetical protein